MASDSISTEFDSAARAAFEAARREIQVAARAHNVKVQAAKVAYASLDKITIAHAPIAGLDKITEEQFATGAAIQLVVISSKIRGDIPSGAYVVVAKVKPGARSGIAIFTDASKVEVVRRNLVVRSPKQSAILFPSVFADPQLIPNVTSTHVWIGNRWAIDCSGANGTFYY